MDKRDLKEFTEEFETAITGVMKAEVDGYIAKNLIVGIMFHLCDKFLTRCEKELTDADQVKFAEYLKDVFGGDAGIRIYYGTSSQRQGVKMMTLHEVLLM